MEEPNWHDRYDDLVLKYSQLQEQVEILLDTGEKMLLFQPRNYEIAEFRDALKMFEEEKNEEF